MKRLFVILYILIFTAIVSCHTGNKTEYGNVLSKIPNGTPIDTTNNLCFILYQPLTCQGCNAIIYNLLGANEFKKAFGHNSFIVFPSIRENELTDYKTNLENSSISINYINDKKLYDYLIQKTNPVTAKPALICFKKSTNTLPTDA